jgi:hypothetical protein
VQCFFCDEILPLGDLKKKGISDFCKAFSWEIIQKIRHILRKKRVEIALF